MAETIIFHADSDHFHNRRPAGFGRAVTPAHGGMIVTTILRDRELCKLWRSELDAMRDRIAQARAALAEGLTERGVPMDCSFMTKQKGMFSFSGRINVAGLTPGNMGFVCDVVAEAMKR